MPHSSGFVLHANTLFSPLDDEGFTPGAHLETLTGAEDIDEGAQALGLYSVLPPADGELLREFLAAIPASLHAGILGALRSTLSRGLRTQFTWQPGYDTELRMWEVSDGSEGLLNLFLVTPHPPESTNS